MRKSLGSKRRVLTEDSIETIVKTYGEFEANDFSKIFDYTDFGYRRIMVERPLKLAFYPRDLSRLEALCEDKAWHKIDEELQQSILEALAEFTEEKILSRTIFQKQLNHQVDRVSASQKLSVAQHKLIAKYLAEQDENAETCLFEAGKNKGQPEPNPDLRDNENIPLKESVQAYFKREVLPHVPDAWIDETKVDSKDGEVGIVGYEIPFNRHFYVYQPPRALEEIDADLDAVSADIMKLLQEVHS
jgi:type I restriction enzyme M protein